MNGVKRKTDPIDRSISPEIINSASPAARIAKGAKYGSRVLKLSAVKKRSFLIEKYTIARTVTTMMLPSRSVRNRLASSPAPGRGARAGAGGAGAPAGAEAASPVVLVRRAGIVS